MTNSERTAITDIPWSVPVPLGNRLCWFDGARNVTIPVTEVRLLHTNAPFDLDRGWHAVLPTENGTEVSLTYDPDYADEEESLSIWLDVRHPQYECRVGAWIKNDHIVYDPECLGDACPGCTHDLYQWFAYVTSPSEVMAHLARLGSLPIKALYENGS